MSVKNYYFAKSLAQVTEFLDLMKESGASLLSVDLETTGLNTLTDNIVIISLSYQENHAIAIPIRCSTLGGSSNLPEAEVVALLKPVLESMQIIMQNGKFDCEFFYRLGVIVKLTFDTMIEAYMTGRYDQLGGYVRSGLKYIVEQEFGIKMVTLEELFNTDTIDMTSLTIEQSYEYACDDAEKTFRIHNKVYPTIKGSRQEFMFNVEMKLVPIVQEIQRNGILIDVEYFNKGADVLYHAVDKLGKIIWEQASKAAGSPIEFEIGSSAQTARVLFTEMKLVPTVFTKGGKASTSADALEDMADTYDVVSNITTWRSLVRQWTATFQTAPTWIDFDGRIHTDFLQAHVGTGRFASKNPNLQNIPDDETGTFELKLLDGTTETIYVNARCGFIPTPGHYFMDADESQVEFRIMAAESGCTGVLRAYAEDANTDFHAKTAAMMFGVPLEQVTKTQRRQAKTINFALLYGEGPTHLAKQLKCSVDEAKLKRTIYFESLPEVKQYIDVQKENAKRRGYIETHFGRRRYIPEFKSDNPMVRAKGERGAVNSIIQGTAADIMKISMVRTYNALKQAGLSRVRILLTIHDELLFEVPNDISPDLVAPCIRKGMEFKVEGYPPLICAITTSTTSWGELEDWHDGEPPYTPTKGEGSQEQTKVVEVIEKKSQRLALYIEDKFATEDRIKRLLQLMTENPGDNIVVIRTGEGDFIMDKYPTSLVVEDRTKFELIFPCKLLQEGEDVNLQNLGKGVNF